MREVDYWDGRHFGITATDDLRAQVGTNPTDYGEDHVPDHSSPELRSVLGDLRTALGSGKAAGLFSVDAVFEDLTLHTRIAGTQAIEAYLERSYTLLPYGGHVAVRHTVGSAQGGGYEWIKAGDLVDRGIVTVELNDQRLITRLTTVWDGAGLDTAALVRLLAATIEQ
jgi:hypothetical protein